MVNSGVGCLSAGGVVLCDNDPMTVSRDGIYRWTSNTDERDESNAKRISEQLAGLLGRDFGAGALAFNYREADEIWIANPADPGGGCLSATIGLRSGTAIPVFLPSTFSGSGAGSDSVVPGCFYVR